MLRIRRDATCRTVENARVILEGDDHRRSMTKVTAVGNNEIYNREYLVGPFVVHTLLAPPPPPPLLSHNPPFQHHALATAPAAPPTPHQHRHQQCRNTLTHTTTTEVSPGQQRTTQKRRPGHCGPWVMSQQTLYRGGGGGRGLLRRALRAWSTTAAPAKAIMPANNMQVRPGQTGICGPTEASGQNQPHQAH